MNKKDYNKIVPKGNGKCYCCGGSGKNPPYVGLTINCTACRGRKTCHMCRGTGVLVNGSGFNCFYCHSNNKLREERSGREPS